MYCDGSTTTVYCGLVADGVEHGTFFKTITEIVHTTERECDAGVHISLIEPKIYSGERPITISNYIMVLNAIKKRLRRQ